jgi:hypothetical protein
MNFAFICEPHYMAGELESFTKRFSELHEINNVSADAILSGKNLEEFHGIIVERRTWQKYYSLFKYFDVLNSLTRAPLAYVQKTRKADPLKGRKNQTDVNFSTSADSSEIFACIDKMMSSQEL